jgi:curved DNA-binding protein CbpA
MVRSTAAGYDGPVAGIDEAGARTALAEMQDRLARDPSSALGLGAHATAEDVRSAFLQLTKRYHPVRFGRMATDIQKLSNEVFLALRAAHDVLAKSLGRRSGAIAVSPAMRGMASRPVRTASDSGERAPVLPRTITPAAGVKGGAAGPATRPLGSSASAAPASSASPASGRVATAAPASVSGRASGVPAPIGQSANHSAGQSANHSAGHSANHSAGQSANHSAGHSANHSAGHSANHSAGASTATGSALARPGAASHASATPPRTITGQPAATAAPASGRDETAVLDLFQRQQWDQARSALHQLLASEPGSKKIRALMSYARGREAQLDRRLDDARVELQDALDLDPDLQLAKTALTELFTRRK